MTQADTSQVLQVAAAMPVQDQLDTLTMAVVVCSLAVVVMGIAMFLLLRTLGRMSARLARVEESWIRLTSKHSRTPDPIHDEVHPFGADFRPAFGPGSDTEGGFYRPGREGGRIRS